MVRIPDSIKGLQYIELKRQMLAVCRKWNKQAKDLETGPAIRLGAPDKAQQLRDCAKDILRVVRGK